MVSGATPRVAMRSTFLELVDVEAPLQTALLYRDRAFSEGAMNSLLEYISPGKDEDRCSEATTDLASDDGDCVILSDAEESKSLSWTSESDHPVDAATGPLHAGPFAMSLVQSCAQASRYLFQAQFPEPATRTSQPTKCKDASKSQAPQRSGAASPSRAEQAGVEDMPVELCKRTSLAIQRMGGGCSRELLCEVLDAAGLQKTYDFVYLPYNFQKNSFFGYGLVNFVTHDAAFSALEQLKLQDWDWASEEPVQVSWSEGFQGLAAFVEKYRNSPVMHGDVPDEFKPVILQDGLRIAFPQPTEEIQFPSKRRLRRRRERAIPTATECDANSAGAAYAVGLVADCWHVSMC